MGVHMHEVVTHAPNETEKLAAYIVAYLKGDGSEERGTSTIVALQGNLGAGKTVFVKGAAEYLGVPDTITSPTFVIVKLYAIPEGTAAPWKKLVHIDAYRLESEDELNSIDWKNLASDPKNLIIIEWPEQVGLGVPERALWLEFETVDENTRKILLPDSVPVSES